MHNFRDIKVWQKSRRLVKDIYEITKLFPKEELYGLTGQMRRSAISIPSNIAEGCGRGTDAQLVHFLNVAQGSSYELETQLILAYDLNFLTKEKLLEVVDKINESEKMNFGFKNSLNI